MNFINTKKQGDWGLGQAIAYFTELGWTVLLPLTDSQDYDLVVDNGVNLLKIQVKTTTFKERNNYLVSLTVKGGNRSYNTIKKFDKSLVDYVFIVTKDMERYLIPSEVLAGSVTLGEKYQKYKL